LRSYAETFANRPGTGIAINLSGNSLNDESLLEYVRAQFEASAVAAELVCFEITETAAIDNLGHAVDFITGIKKNGSRVAIDDFGSGLSSFKYLKTLPTDFLKIDGSFVRDMLENPVDHALVEAINEVGHIMGIQTIAEYVHSPAIMDRLAVIGVDCAQGFAIGEPSPLR
jgi:EAL domain-containing protein (putative c-di-GMP-specific phosphodiesterase class I)